MQSQSIHILGILGTVVVNLSSVIYTVTCKEAWFPDGLVICADGITDGFI